MSTAVFRDLSKSMGLDEDNFSDPLRLSSQWQERARVELNEEPVIARSNIELLRSLVLSEKNLYGQTDDTFLLAFLRARKHNVEEAFKLFKNYYRLKKQFPKHLEDCLPSEKPFAYEMNGFTVLAEKDQHDRFVIGIRVEEVDLSRVRQEHFFQVLVTMLTVQIQNPLVQIAGVTVLVDMTGLSLRKAAIVTPTFARIAIRIMQDSFPLRMKAIHIVFEPLYFDAIFALFKPFLKEKMRRRNGANSVTARNLRE
ncbi:alpha-tocopherol transfer protein-like isoform X2 [Anabrus simplex]|uniref:alpha-tocopherol transfer protein-like isoform X2 n=1 Tax=Anabrus simplex TaxID=316456 RepID=UPI0035A2948A